MEDSGAGRLNAPTGNATAAAATATPDAAETVSGAPEEPRLRLKLKTIDNSTHPIEAVLSWNVRRFKEQIATELGVAVDLQRLLFRGRLLLDDQPMSCLLYTSDAADE